MVEIREKKTTTITEMKLVDIKCDICDKSIQELGYETLEMEISIKEGVNYGSDGAYGTETEVDLCSDCFKNKLLVWLKEEHNVNPRVREYNY